MTDDNPIPQLEADELHNMHADRTEPTPSLAEYRHLDAEDGNAFWRLQSGDHQNLLEEAIEEIDRLRAQLARTTESLMYSTEENERLSGSIQECGSDIHDGVFDDPEESS